MLWSFVEYNLVDTLTMFYFYISLICVLKFQQYEDDWIDNIFGSSWQLIAKDKLKIINFKNYHTNFNFDHYKGYYYSNPFQKFNSDIINVTMNSTMFENTLKNQSFCFTPEIKAWVLKEISSNSVCYWVQSSKSFHLIYYFIRSTSKRSSLLAIRRYLITPLISAVWLQKAFQICL